MKSSSWAVAVALLVGGCTKNNPDFCCLTPDDCSAQGTDDNSRPCKDGLACVQNECVAPVCASDGCEADAPVCEVTTGVCSACTGPMDCMRFTATPVCDSRGAGECVECLGNEDCTTTAPICDSTSCRRCASDDECSSGACDPSGACLSSAEAIYVSPQGTDAGDCTQSAPCKSLAFASSLVSASRLAVVFAAGDYALVGSSLNFNAAGVLRPTLYGHGARFTASNDDYLLRVTNTALHDFEFEMDTVSRLEAPLIATSSLLERVKFRGNRGPQLTGSTTMRDFEIRVVAHEGIALGTGAVALEQGLIAGGVTGITSNGNNVAVDIENVVISRTTGMGLFLEKAQANVRFVTLDATGSEVSVAPSGIRCDDVASAVHIADSVIWNPESVSAAITGACTVDTDSIVGPTSFGPARNEDPQLLPGEFHISATSPARDAVDIGPAADFEGDPRPRGARFDIGADEAP